MFEAFVSIFCYKCNPPRQDLSVPKKVPVLSPTLDLKEIKR